MSGVTRQRSRVIAVVHSHVQQQPDNGVIELSKDLIELNTFKSIKGPGNATLTLVPNRNYLNVIYPNDVINIYIDPGDGKRGFIRTFFGYIDRVELSETVDDIGAVTTRFMVYCTDFFKAIDKTEVYFNPELATHQEFVDPRFGVTNLGGIALYTRGITAFGSPADFIENMLQLMFGFGSQWVLPNSYPQAFRIDARNRRLQRAKSRAPKALKTFLETTGYGDLEAAKPGEDLRQALQNIVNSRPQTVPSRFAGPEAQKILIDHQKRIISDILEDNSLFLSFATIVKETGFNTEASILDLLELSFIEALSIDGWVSDAGVWQNQGSLASLLYGFSNEIVNELCFDLRPVVDGFDSAFGNGDGVHQEYSRASDELGINVNGYGVLPGSVAGVQYRPAVVMREYPFSVVEGLDLSDHTVITEEDGTEKKFGFIRFGPIFKQGLRTSGRYYYDYLSSTGVKAITQDPDAYDSNDRPLKHIDVVSIRKTDIVTSNIGRSDADTFNLFALYSSSSLMEFWKFLVQNFVPLTTPVSIKRHGLRVFTPSTMFANYSRDSLSLTNKNSGVDGKAERVNMVRWSLLMDHWNQHNIEYLSGSFTLRGMPEIRVGYRLDHLDRNESYYVEQVNHAWRYPEGPLVTTVQVSRGQRHDPFPAYVPPILTKQEPAKFVGPLLLTEHVGGDRSENGRLGQFFKVKDTPATLKAARGIPSAGDTNDADIKESVGFKKDLIYPEDRAKINPGKVDEPANLVLGFEDKEDNE